MLVYPIRLRAYPGYIAVCPDLRRSRVAYQCRTRSTKPHNEMITLAADSSWQFPSSSTSFDPTVAASIGVADQPSRLMIRGRWLGLSPFIYPVESTRDWSTRSKPRVTISRSLALLSFRTLRSHDSIYSMLGCSVLASSSPAEPVEIPDSVSPVSWRRHSAPLAI